MSHSQGDVQGWTLLPTACSSVLVARDPETLDIVLAVYSRLTGALVFPDRVHMVPRGRTAAGEAITTFGLDRIRMFPADAADEAVEYAAHLQAEAQGGAPVIL